MVKNSSNRTSTSPSANGKAKTSEPIDPYHDFERKEILQKNHYFDNELVERLLYEYHEGACCDVKLRDLIMKQTEELINQIIIAHNLSRIYPGRDPSSIGDLFQTAWVQIEGALYKYDARPHCSKCYTSVRPNESLLAKEFIFTEELQKKIGKCPKCATKLERSSIYYKGTSKVFNMWSQIARTVILAYIKKENRDRKNSPVFQTHLENRPVLKSHALDRFLTEAQEICKYNKDHLHLLETIKELYEKEEKPNEGLIAKLVIRSGLSRATVNEFLGIIRLRSHDFTDSPVNEENDYIRKRTTEADNHDE